MATMVFLKVKIGTRYTSGKREADHPDFNLLPSVQSSGIDWSHYVDQFGGWHYDKVSGHLESDKNNASVPVDHPHRNDEFGYQYGCLYVPEEFANEAVAQFGSLCVIIDEASFEAFYDDRANAHLPDVLSDGDIVSKLRDQMALEANPLVTTPPVTAEEKARRDAALDPKNQTVRGLRNNLRKRYATAKANMPGVLRADLVKP